MALKPVDVRYVCQFSCGAASAIAAKIVLSEGHPNTIIVNAYVEEEHKDNRRFLAAGISPFCA